MGCLHINLATLRYVNSAIDWRWSSFHRWVWRAVYLADWAVAAEGVPHGIILNNRKARETRR